MDIEVLYLRIERIFTEIVECEFCIERVYIYMIRIEYARLALLLIGNLVVVICKAYVVQPYVFDLNDRKCDSVLFFFFGVGSKKSIVHLTVGVTVDIGESVSHFNTTDDYALPEQIQKPESCRDMFNKEQSVVPLVGDEDTVKMGIVRELIFHTVDADFGTQLFGKLVSDESGYFGLNIRVLQHDTNSSNDNRNACQYYN